ncbi:MAG: hypothetical protein BGO69_12770 [Bacteroidetes bacterium 46-16]|nr:MAG: hypothetical protein BGO69_12770 [Bacteroidetes bacterium 46-16]
MTSINVYAGTKKMIFCKSGIEITITSKKKISLDDQWSEYPKWECGGNVYTGCTQYIKAKRGSLSVCFVFADTIPNSFVKIDSCFQSLTIENRLVNLCRLTVYGNKMFVAKIAIGNHIINLTFKKEEYDFAIELLQSMRISQVEPDCKSNTPTTPSTPIKRDTTSHRRNVIIID